MLGESNNNTGNLSLSPLDSFLCAKIKKTTIKISKKGCCCEVSLFFWFGVFSPPALSPHGRFHLSFTSAVFPTQFFYLSQGIHSLGVYWNSLNIISNIWQSLWNVNEMRNQIYLECRSGTAVSDGCRCLGRDGWWGAVITDTNWAGELELEGMG